MNWKNIDKRQLTIILIAVAGTFILSLIRVQLDTDVNGVNTYASLQDAGIFASVMALGAPWGVIAPVIGIVIGDIVMGSKNFIIGNLLIRSLMALFVLAFASKCDNWKKSFVVAGMTEGIMLILFAIYDLLIIREFRAFGLLILLQLIQGVICALIGTAVLRFMPVMQPDKMLEIRRPVD